MAIIFCTECGARNQRGVTECRRCKYPIVSFERVDLNQWEEVDPIDLALDEAMPLSLWGRVKQRPILTSAAALSLLVLLGGAGWLVSYLNRPPRCLEYQNLECSAIVFERTARLPVSTAVDDSGVSTDISKLSYSQAEVLDWLRLLAMSRRPDGTVQVATLIDNSSAQSGRMRACYGITECLTIADLADIDYDGVSGQVGVTASGVVRTVSLTSSSKASPVLEARGRIPAGLPISPQVVGSFEELHLIASLKNQRLALSQVATQIRSELREAAIPIRVRVMHEAHSRSSSLSAARIFLATSGSSLRQDGTEVLLEIQSADRAVVWRASFSATIAHVLDAARQGVPVGEKSIVVADCGQHLMNEAVDAANAGADVEVVCFESARFKEVISSSESVTRWLLISSQRELEMVTNLVTAIKSLPLLVMRL